MIYNLLAFFLKFLSRIPFGAMYVLSDGLFYAVYYLAGYRRGVVRKNLVGCFPEKSEQEIKKIEKKFYRFFTDLIFESCKMASIPPSELRRRMKFTNVEAAKAVLREGKTISLYMGHYGNWEWVSSMPLWMEDDVTSVQIYHKLSNDNMNKLILNNRERMGAVSVEMRKTARYITEQVASHNVSIIGFIADQAPRKKDIRYYLPFLNHRTPVLTGTEKIIKHYGFDAWFLKMRRVKRGYYEAEFVQLHDNTHSLPDFELTDSFFQALEQMILECPELYLWSHNRFRGATKLGECKK